VWVKLTRSGNTFSGYYSTDGVTWTQIGTAQTIALNPTVQAGLAVTAHNNGRLNAATFENVSLSVPVDLSSSYTQIGIVSDGTLFTGGLDGNGNAYSANLLGSSVTVDGLTFQLGPANVKNVLAAQGQTLALAAGSFSGLSFLATGVNGSQPGQVFTVQYSDGTSDSFGQDLSDWFNPQGYDGESVGAALDYYNAADGSSPGVSNYLYRYTLALNRQKTVSSITLPVNANVVILGLDLLG
jgi:hypothetical protein